MKIEINIPKEFEKAKSRIDIGIDNYEMGYYVGLLKAIQIIKGDQIYD